jgi:hypothetical protein
MFPRLTFSSSQFEVFQLLRLRSELHGMKSIRSALSFRSGNSLSFVAAYSPQLSLAISSPSSSSWR